MSSSLRSAPYIAHRTQKKWKKETTIHIVTQLLFDTQSPVFLALDIARRWHVFILFNLHF
jgi:hypothetical protein